MPRLGVYPGSFNPPTIAHLAIAEEAKAARHLDRVVLMQSRRPLGKDEVERPRFSDRVAVLEAVAAARPWLEAAVTSSKLLVEIADGYDVLILGADKWHQIQEVRWYEDEAERDAAMAALPELAIAPRPPLEIPPALALEVADATIDGISSTAARSGRLDVMAPEARRFAEHTGAWVDPNRYDHWVSVNGERSIAEFL